METFFNIQYEFDPTEVHNAISKRLQQPGSDYICVADGVVLDNATRHKKIPLGDQWRYVLHMRQLIRATVPEMDIRNSKISILRIPDFSRHSAIS